MRMPLEMEGDWAAECGVGGIDEKKNKMMAQ
jgi:hypothetical protein